MDEVCFAARLDSQVRAKTSMDWRADLRRIDRTRSDRAHFAKCDVERPEYCRDISEHMSA